jgi:hypothetical protein
VWLGGGLIDLRTGTAVVLMSAMRDGLFAEFKNVTFLNFSAEFYTETMLIIYHTTSTRTHVHIQHVATCM